MLLSTCEQGSLSFGQAILLSLFYRDFSEIYAQVCAFRHARHRYGATIVGQNMGAKQPDRAEKGYRFSMWISVVFLFIGGMILSRDMISTAIVRIFSKDAEVVGMAADFLSVMAFWCFTNGVYNTTSGLFQGTGHTEVTMAIDVTRLWVFRFLTLWFCESVLHMGVRSVWYSVVISNGISALILYVLYRCGIWKKTRIKVGKEEAT